MLVKSTVTFGHTQDSNPKFVTNLAQDWFGKGLKKDLNPCTTLYHVEKSKT